MSVQLLTTVPYVCQARAAVTIPAYRAGQNLDLDVVLPRSSIQEFVGEVTYDVQWPGAAQVGDERPRACRTLDTYGVKILTFQYE